MNFFKKWYTYQKERFPIAVYGSYILAIVLGVFCYATLQKPLIYALMYNKDIIAGFPIDFMKIIPMFVVAFMQFLMVRIIDEFKDYDEDCKYRSYRPVPRGLITLKELKVLFAICTIIQVGTTYFVSKISLIYLAVLWIFFVIMSKNFFMKKVLDKYILIEVILDELMMPFLVLFLTSFVYYTHLCLWPILLMSYIISCIVEIARKIRCKEDEEEGVKTYTAVFGINVAVQILFFFETALMLVHSYIFEWKYLLYTIGIYLVTVITNVLFIAKKTRKYAKAAELVANLYVFVCYVSLFLLII